MRPSRFLVPLLVLTAFGCQPGENAVLIDVHTQADLDRLRVIVLSLDSGRRWEEPIRRVNRTAGDINADPLRVAVILPGPETVLIQLDGLSPAGDHIVATRCYAVNGVITDEVMLFGPLGDLDLDGDGFAESAASTCREAGADGSTAVSCDADLYVCPEERGADCDAANGDIYPGAPTICLDGIDQDCDGSDEPCGDQDGDGVDACPMNPTGPCDCNDNVPSINPRAEDVCNDGIDQDCTCNDGTQTCAPADRDACCDADGDLSPACGSRGPDCDDTNPAISPGATEACDGIDNNCNGQVDELDECRGPDLDGDGIAACGREDPGDPCDCNDCDRAIFQGARELCGPRVDPGMPGNRVDEDCDGMIDEGCPAGDLDGDGVEPPRDCDDTNPLIFPPTGGREPIDRCGDTMADNCIPGEDAPCSADSDGDGWAEPAACEATTAINPTALDICNGTDDDCDGTQDEVLSIDGSVGCVAGMEIRFDSDFLNCGGCRVACDPQTANRCLASSCDCEWNAAGGECAASDTCCPGLGCRNLMEDETSCGVCGNACGEGETCVGGRCTCGGVTGAMGEDACPETLGGLEANVCCGTTCRDVSSDNGNCGMCGHACGAHSACNDRLCECDPPTATEAWEDCNTDLPNMMNDGCELNTRASDVDNCGGCGRACSPPNATPRCATGSCQINTCLPGFADCDASPGNGCETSLSTLASCGACGVACTRMNATPTCASGSCDYVSCNSGFGDCDGNRANGCETPLNTTTNCGGCGVSCTRNNATATCGSGSCAIQSCNSGFANCDGADMNGCEASLDANATCGACGNSCGSNATCVSRACVCNAGRLDCPPGSPYCETAFSTTNCGACGATCGTSESCNAMGRCACGVTTGGVGTGAACASGQGCCSGSCAALNTTTNCRSCGNSCDSDETCGAGGCTCGVTTRASGPACPSPASCCPSGCANLTGGDTNNCGSCGNVCRPGETCSGSACHCNGGAGCTAGQTCCTTGGAPGCADLMADEANCGSCGRACGAGEVCVGGSCQCNGGAACTGGNVCCPSVGCVDTTTSTMACGGCGTMCSAGQGCCGGTCRDLSTASNCGACGAACGTNETCSSYMSSFACVCGGMPGSDPTGSPGGGPACTGGTSFCCDGTGSGGGDDVCRADAGMCP